MGLLDRFVHPLAVIRTPWDDSDEARDEYGQPLPTTPEVQTVQGLVQPRSGRDMALSHDAGAQMSDHVIFLPLMDVIAADSIRHDPDDGRRYEIGLVRRFEYGTSPHLEVDARLVSGTVRVAEVGS